MTKEQTMTEVRLSRKEKELIAVGAAVAAGCQKCADYHFNKIFEVGVTLPEVKKAVADAACVIDSARESMQGKAYALLKIPRGEVAECCVDSSERVAVLVKLGAAVAVNCTSNISKHMQLAQSLGVTDHEITVVTGIAKAVRNKAGEFADQAISQGLANKNADKTTCSGVDQPAPYRPPSPPEAPSQCGCGCD